MKILFISHYSSLYGANRSLLTIIDGLQADMIPLVLVPKNGPLVKELESRGVSCYIRHFTTAFPSGKRSFLNFLLRLRHLPRLLNITRKLKPDLLYTNSSVIDYGALLSPICRIPHIWHIREFGMHDYGVIYDGGSAIYNYLLRKSNIRIAISESIKEDRLAKLPAEVIYNGVISDLEIGQARRINSETLQFSIIGLIQSSKGQESAVRAFAEFRKVTNSAQLNIVGSGNEEYLNSLKDIVEASGIEDHVHFTGFIDSLKEIYENTDILLMCSEKEGFGRVTAEAMANGIPVIGKNAGGTAEIIDHGKNGLLYNKHNELVQYMHELAGSKQMYQEISANAIQTARQYFTVERYNTAINRIIRQAVTK